VELSQYFKTKEEESTWFANQESSALTRKVVQHLRKHGSSFIKDIPFQAVWEAFWKTQKAHIFVEEPKKAAVVYAYNTETRQYIGGLLDVTQRKDLELFHKEHSVVGREALVVRGGKVVERFVKEENKHCFPIFPRWNPKTTQHHFELEGWDYYLDCRAVNLRYLEVPKEPSADSQS
jgi:hypothetical protein